MRWELEADLGVFDERVRPLFEAHLVNNVVATVLTGTIQGQFHASPSLLVVGMDDDGAVAAAALRTAPWPMLCTPVDPGDASALADLWLEHDPELPGVNAELGTARAIAGAWTSRSGGSDRCRTAMAMHSLTTVVNPPRPGPGELVTATEADRDLALSWWDDFVTESRVIDAGPESRVATVDFRIGAGHLFLWRDDGRPVSMVSTNPPVAGVVLYTDLANPTSNRIYADVGYRRFGEWEERVFQAVSPRT
ncbi:MAG TPA: hypothetical protein VHV28_08900 [Solirubrobacteraceae bacterium]|jgi:predicted GNAT family acetyltransferase|nr:hypothetical protein [Solirubrobacteraceae bacterium]